MDKIGKYEIIDKIGAGGFAVVYKGYDPFIKRPVAIKVCYSRDEETRSRFYREAEIAGRLVHRNITTVYDFGLNDQMPYLVEEYLSGEDLAHMIRRHEPEVLEEKLDYLLQIADGLAFAHAQGVIHRDIKPGNVRVLDNGRIKIMDFGTAKLTGVESNLTQTGMTLGTVAYLAPERLQGHSAEANSDIFSFGVLAYELLTYRRPFEADNIPMLIDRVLNAPPVPILDRMPDCPPVLAEIVERCLVKEPGGRYVRCDEVIAGLERFRDEHTLHTRFQEPANETSDTLVMPESEMLTVLIERARQLLELGKPRRAVLLLEEVLESDTEHDEAQRLLARCRAAADAAPSDDDASGRVAAADSPQARRQRKVDEAVSSIERYLIDQRLAQAADALRFAIHLLGDFPEADTVRAKLVTAYRTALLQVRRQGHEQATRITRAMRTLQADGRLQVDLAEHFAESAVDLDPHDLAARELLSQIRQQASRAGTADQDLRQAEAVASIEQLIAAGKPDMAAQALQFAVGLFGDFEQAATLRRRIHLAQRQP